MNLKSLRLSYSMKISLDIHLRLLEELENMKSRLKKELKSLCEKERYREMVNSKKNCSGIGWLSAIRFTLEWGELSPSVPKARLLVCWHHFRVSES